MLPIAHPVNYHAHRRNMHWDYYTNIHFRPNLVQNWLIPSWKQHWRYQNWLYLSIVQKLVNIQVSLTLAVYKTDNGIEI